jgi:hypothetical protein
VVSQGRGPKLLFLRALQTLPSGAQALSVPPAGGGENPADAYLTLLAYEQSCGGGAFGRWFSAIRMRSLNDPRQGSLWGSTGTGRCRESVPRVKRGKRRNGFLAIRR